MTAIILENIELGSNVKELVNNEKEKLELKKSNIIT